jgi:hypothetical protein
MRRGPILMATRTDPARGFEYSDRADTRLNPRCFVLTVFAHGRLTRRIGVSTG